MVGPLATYVEPHSYDLCEAHALRLTAPRGWEVVRHEGEFSAPVPSTDDLEALANAVREAARPERRPTVEGTRPPRGPGGIPPGYGPGRRGHLRVVSDPEE